MYPTIFQFHGLALHSYGLLLAIAFLVGIQLFLKRGVERGLPEDKLSTLSLILLVLAIIGGRGLYVLTHWSDYSKDPLGVFRIFAGVLANAFPVLAKLKVVRPLGMTLDTFVYDYEVWADIAIARTGHGEEIPAVCCLDPLKKIDCFALGIHVHPCNYVYMIGVQN